MRILAVCALALLPNLATAQDEPAPENSPDEVRKLIEEQRRAFEAMNRAHEQRIRELESQLREVLDEREKQREEDDLDELLRLAEASGPAPVARPSSNPSILNPQISVIPDFVARFREVSGDNMEDAFGHLFEDTDPFSLRETAIEFRAPISPEADGYAALSVGDEEAEFEEAYIEFHSLPWDLQAKVGKFFIDFGRMNRVHTHNLPQVDRPVVYNLLFGHHAFASPGVSVSKVLHTSVDAGLVPAWTELTVEAINSTNDESPLFGDGEVNEVAVNSRLKNFWQLTEDADLESGISFLATGNNKSGNNQSSRLLGTDLTWRWTDPEPGSYNSWLVQGELIGSSVDVADDDTVDALGGYVFVQKQLDPQWYAGIRVDAAESPFVEDADVWGVYPYVSYYLNEFIRLRLQYEYLKGSHHGDSAEAQGLSAQLSWVFGAHPPHPYWVNQ